VLGNGIDALLVPEAVLRSRIHSFTEKTRPIRSPITNVPFFFHSSLAIHPLSPIPSHLHYGPALNPPMKRGC
jgi:hypothetical protein